MAKCKGSGAEYLAVKAKLEGKAEGKKAVKAGALVVAEVNEAAEEKKPLVTAGGRQQGIKSSLSLNACIIREFSLKCECDEFEIPL